MLVEYIDTYGVITSASIHGSTTGEPVRGCFVDERRVVYCEQASISGESSLLYLADGDARTELAELSHGAWVMATNGRFVAVGADDERGLPYRCLSVFDLASGE